MSHPTPTCCDAFRLSCSPLQVYLQQIDETPLLSAEQERDLAWRIQQGDAEARDHLVRANLRLVVKLARLYTGKGLDRADLIAEGNLGLLRAAEDFDPAMNTRFSTYAVYWIRQSMGRALNNTGHTVRLPAYMAQLLVRWRRAAASLQDELGRPPLEAEVACRLNLSRKKLRLVREAIRVHIVGLEGTPGDDGWVMDDLPADGGGPDPAAALMQAEEVRKALRLVDWLETRERTILRLRFGLDCQPPRTLREVGKRLGLTRERVRQIERQALARLQEMLLESDGGPRA
jgi:RNA polymerase primary sigma factor